MAELVDAIDSKSIVPRDVSVRVGSEVPHKIRLYLNKNTPKFMLASVSLIAVVKAIILGLIEGLTEFIPVSSTAHLLLASKFLDFSYIRNSVFEISIQLGAILAICFLYRTKLINLVLKSHKDRASRNLTINIIIAFLPAAIIGVLFHKIIKEVLFSPNIIALALIIGGIAIIVVEKYLDLKPQHHRLEELSKFQSLIIGLFQTLAMIPGISRSGATIIGGLLLKLDRRVATEFSFFLAIPTIFGATFYDLYKNFDFVNGQDFKLIAIGFLSSFLSSLFIIKWFINFVSSHNFLIFAYYRIVVGLIILIVML